MSDDEWPTIGRGHAKTGECFQCGARGEGLEVCSWVKADGTEVQHPRMRMQCVDEAACDVRIHDNMKKATIIGLGPVQTRIGRWPDRGEELCTDPECDGPHKHR